MTYATTITKSGQITLNKLARDLLGVKPGDRVNIDTKKDELTITRTMTDEELLAYIDNTTNPVTKKLIKKHAGKTVNELKSEWLNTPEGQSYLKEEYGN